MITFQSLVVLLIIGAVAGWLAGLIMQGRGFGLVGNIVVGIVGALVGGFVFSQLGIPMGGWVRDIIGATIGAVILLFIIGLVKKA